MKHIKIAAGLDRYFDFGYVEKLVKVAMDAGCDICHSDATDMYSMKRSQLIGGHNVVIGIREATDKPIECHFYTEVCDLLFIEKMAESGCNLLLLPAETFVGEHLATIIYWCHSKGMRIGLTIGRYAPLSIIEESIYDIDQVHVVTHLTDQKTGSFVKDKWNRNSISLIERTRKLIDEKNPNCILSVEGGLTAENIDEIVKCNPDEVIFTNAIFDNENSIKEAVAKCRKAVDEAAKKYNL